jgi:uncharacterized C2H2 Zn-finger protein
MPVPTHGPDCQTKTYWPTICRECGMQVIFWSCTCGSKVFFEVGFPDLIKHECKFARTQKYSRTEEKPTSNPLIRCPFCPKKMEGRNLAGHVKQFHASEIEFHPKENNIPTPLLNGIEIRSPDLVEEFTNYVIDENGFLVLSETVTKNNIPQYSRKSNNPIGFSRSVEQDHVFDEIKSIESKKTGTISGRLTQRPDEEVKCPICNKLFYYKELYTHVTYTHKEQNAKKVLAQFNREHKRLAH